MPSVLCVVLVAFESGMLLLRALCQSPEKTLLSWKVRELLCSTVGERTKFILLSVVLLKLSTSLSRRLSSAGVCRDVGSCSGGSGSNGCGVSGRCDSCGEDVGCTGQTVEQDA